MRAFLCGAIFPAAFLALGVTGPAAASEDGRPDRDLCAALTLAPSPSGAEYQAGVDARGRPVAPADMDGGYDDWLPDVFTIPITVDLAERFGLGAGGEYVGKVEVGTVTVHRDGRVFFNDRPIDPEGRHALAMACKELYGD